uniref:Uncharacterized protein n=1 Tax=Cyclophora tenuis TaxID=216820 RepID=A0A7S1GRG0_CYCTE|mmetsp:Transcript_7156/g.12452  ORF Transcript_7156/g.12452 Transcript_7156/m.12452 type:complete len:114 (+) Transcript_7156:27-368(+)
MLFQLFASYLDSENPKVTLADKEWTYDSLRDLRHENCPFFIQANGRRGMVVERLSIVPCGSQPPPKQFARSTMRETEGTKAPYRHESISNKKCLDMFPPSARKILYKAYHRVT